MGEQSGNIVHLSLCQACCKVLNEDKLQFTVKSLSYPITHLTTFRSQSAIVFENPMFSLIEKPKFPNLTLPYNRSRLFEQTVPNATYQFVWKSVHWFQQRFLKGHMTQTPRTNFRFPYPRRLHIKFGFDWPSGFRGDL